ncbi:MAG TPA: hypothetical protein VGX96_13600 [Candidatus Elarobacter sp.]|jgi:hypothetical protein|nr:hypothetical protein [Candidatus Elarobacter sp.]
MAHLGTVTLPREENGKTKGDRAVELTGDGDGSRELADFRRVHVIFPQRVYAKIQLMAKRKGVTITEALRQAVYLADHIERAIQEDNASVVINRNGERSEIVIP